MSGKASKRGPAVEVQIFGIDRANKPFSERAAVLEFSPGDVLLDDVRASLRADDIVGLRCGDRKVRYYVTWIGRMGSNQSGQVRLRTLEPTKNLWGPLLPDGHHHGRFPTALEATLQGAEPKWQGHNRREHARMPCKGKVQYHLPGSNASAFATLRDISRGGCYVETPSTMPKNAELDLDLQAEGLHLRTFGIVQASNPGFGMGIRFRHMQDVYRNQLEQWIAHHS